MPSTSSTTAAPPAPPARAPAGRIIGLDRPLDAASISDPSALVRQSALGTVLARPQSATPLRGAIAARLADASESEAIRVLAARALGLVRPLPVADLVPGLGRPQGPLVRAAATTSLIAGPGEAAQAAEPLARCLLAGDRSVRMQSVLALRGIGGAAVPAIARVVEESEKFDITRMAGMDALGLIGADAEPALPLAERLAGEAPPMVMACARFAVASIKSGSAKAGPGGDGQRARQVGPLLDMLGHYDHKARALAMERLGWLKDGAPSAGPALVGLLKDGVPPERESAALGLARTRTPADIALDPLIAALDDPEPGVRKAACVALSAYGQDARPALDPLLALVRNTSEPAEVRRGAGEAAKMISKATKGPYWT